MSRQRRAKSGMGDQLRAELVAEHHRQTDPGGRWALRPGPDGEHRVADAEYWAAMEAGEDVVVSSSSTMSALMRIGLPHADFTYGGKFYEGRFVLGADGTITPYVPD